MYTQIASNKRRTIFIIAVFVAFVVFLGWLVSLYFGSTAFMIGFGIFALIYAWVGYYASDKIALGLSGARPIEKSGAPELYRVVENLSIASGLPMPKIYIIPDAAPNAFATGRDPQHASVAVTAGLLDMMNESELEGVLAHELSHVGNYDIRLMAIVMVLVTIVTVISNFFFNFGFWGGRDDRENGQAGAVIAVVAIVMAILAPIVATLLQLAVSRRREYLADASGALLTRYPDGLADALRKIDQSSARMRHASTATAHLYIANPLKGSKSWMANMFSTHPPIADRIAKLEKMEIAP